MIKLIVDSTTDLPIELYEKYQIDMVPLIVHLNNQTYKDKETISVDDVYEALKSGQDVKTSQPNLDDIFRAIKKHAENNDDVIFISISKNLSGTFQSINLIAEDLKEQYPNVRIEIIDSHGGSAIPGLIAIQAAHLINANVPYDDIITTLTEMANHSEHIFTVNDLKYLFKSGRLSKATALIGNLLRVKPILQVKDGEITLIKKVRGQKKALSSIIDITEERMKDFPDQPIAIMHANDYDLALEVKDKIVERFGEKEIMIDQIGSVLGTHIGISGVGIFFFSKKPKQYINKGL